jgi:outer membrane receptor for monomeric catechols
VFFPIRQLGAYANYAETFNPVSAGTGSSGTGLQGQEYGPTRSHAYSGGLRFRLLRDRLVGSLGYYQMTEANRVAQYSAVGINRIWTNLNRGELQVNPAANSYRDTLDFFGSGVELDLTANFGRNFRLRGNMAKPKTRQTKTIPGLRAYYAQHIAAWRAGAADASNPDQSQIATDIGSIETTLSNANENRVLNNTPDYTGSIFGMYTLTDTRLKGLRFGGGVAWQGPRVIGNEVGRSYDYVKSDGYSTANLSIGYPLRLRGRLIDLQFNVTNLLDHSDPIYNGTNPFQGRTVRTLHHYLDARKAVLAITHRF